MTDEMTVQAQRPSAMPYVLGGAGVGAVAGGSLAKWGNIGLKGQAYSSFEELVKEASDNDKFTKIKDMAAKDGNVGKDWTVLKEAAEEMNTATKTFNDAVPEAIRSEQTLTEYVEKLAAQEKAVTEYDNKVAEAIAKAKETLKGPVGDDGKQLLDDVGKEITWNVDGKGNLNAEQFKKFAESTDADDVKLFREFAEKNDATKELFGDGEKSIIKAQKEARKTADDAVKNAREALETKAKELKIEAKDIDVDKWSGAKKTFTEAAEKAKKNVTDDALAKCKNVKVGLTALAGAAALALIGALIRPKGEQA